MSGYTACACRDCFEIAIGEPGKAFCSECEEAGCPDHQAQPGMGQECQVEPGATSPCCGCGVHRCATGGPECCHCDDCGGIVVQS
jgi:hypothetical protein